MRRLIYVAAIALFALSGLLLFVSPAQAEDLSPEQADKIKANCSTIKTSLNQLHATDALLRVNRGQMYESMASNLMETFNGRLSNNSLDNRAMETVTKNYRATLTGFRSNYIAYEQKLAQVIKIDCQSQPNTFHNTLLEARELRGKVHEDVKRLHRLIDDYRTSVSDFLLNYERLSS